jgi:DNA adenine methylase
MLTRLGNKTQLAPKVHSYFPPHRARVYLFFGAGGVYFNTPKARFNFLNDLDDDVTNLWLVVTHQMEELKEAIEMMPISSSLMKHWQKNEEQDPVLKAIRFLFRSNFTYLGKGDTLKIGVNHTKRNILQRIKPTFKALAHATIMSYDFREVLSKISFHPKTLTREETFIYLDPVYLDTGHWYKVPKWTKDDTYDCFEIMSNEGILAAMSEFRHPFVIAEAKRRGFMIIPIVSRRNIKNRKDEILITNYEPQNILF